MKAEKVANWIVNVAAIAGNIFLGLGWWDQRRISDGHQNWIQAVADVQHEQAHKQWLRDHHLEQPLPAKK